MVGARAIHSLLASSLLIIARSTVEVVQKLGSLASLEAAYVLGSVGSLEAAYVLGSVGSLEAAYVLGSRGSRGSLAFLQ